MTDTPRVALYIPALDFGGAERVTTNIANGFVVRGYAVDLLLSNERGEFRDQVSDGATTVILEAPEIPGVGVGGSLFGLRKYLERANPDVLISAMTHANVVALAAATLSRGETTVVVTEHAEFGKVNIAKDHVVYSLAARLYPTAARVIAVSDGVARSITDATPVDTDDVTVLHNPIDVSGIRRRARARLDDPWLDSYDLRVVLTAGRLAPTKDLPMLLEAFERVHERRPDTRLVVAGKGDQRQSLLSLSEQRGLGDVVSFPGYVDNPYAYMSRADVFALSSKHEGLPTVLVEALACGCPVVATDCPSGPREILVDGEYGALVPVGHSDAFAEAVLATLEDPPDPDRLRERSEDFSMDVAVDRYAEFIEQIVRNRSVG